ncbi:MAG: MSCRAMM family protein, partial [Vagococcus sp.]
MFLNKKGNMFMLLLLLLANIVSPFVYVVHAESGGNDVSSSLVSNISFMSERITSGEQVTFRVDFNDSNKKIETGDMIRVNWPSEGNVYINGYTGDIDINVKGISIGTAVVTPSGVQLVFNQNVEQFDKGTVSGGFEFQMTGYNLSKDENKTSVSVTAGNQQKELNIYTGGVSGDVVGDRGFAYKGGVIDPAHTDKVLWDIQVNQDKKHLHHAIRVTDTIKGNQTEQVLLPETFIMAVSGQNNEMFYGLEEIKTFEKNYFAEFNYSVEDGTINFVIPHDTGSANTFRLMYETKIVNKFASEFYNDLHVDYQEWSKEPENKDINASVKNVSGNGWGNGDKKGTIVLSKVDEVTQTPLQNAEFSLYDKDKNEIKTGLVTDEKGRIEIDHLLPGDYYVKETKAPDGYLKLEEFISIKLDKPLVEQTITNKEIEKPLGELQIIKKDAENTQKVLSDAEFTLTSVSDSKKVYTFKTDEAGKGYVGNLDLGTYKLVETKAPDGYQLDEESKEVVIEEKKSGDSIDVLTVLNKPIKKVKPVGSLDVTKVDASNKAKQLSGAKF